jgi:hypothetical protein
MLRPCSSPYSPKCVEQEFAEGQALTFAYTGIVAFVPSPFEGDKKHPFARCAGVCILTIVASMSGGA